MSSSTSHVRHYQYDFAPSTSASTRTAVSRQVPESLHGEDEHQVTGAPHAAALEPIVEDRPLVADELTMQTAAKRAKSTSAAQSTRKKKSKYYRERVLTSDEIELREALRLIDLDNIGFFPPSELRKVLLEVGIPAGDVGKLERCLPLDDDGHYSIDNLVKLLLGARR